MVTKLKSKLIAISFTVATMMLGMINKAVGLPDEFDDMYDESVNYILEAAAAAQRRQNTFIFFMVVLILGVIIGVIVYLKKQKEAA